MFERWTARRKAVILHAVRSGVLSKDEVLEQYSLSPEEINEWSERLDMIGIHGLKAGLRINT